MIKLTAAQLKGIVSDLITAGPPAGRLNGAKVRLYKNDVVPNEGSVLSDFVAADFTGYGDSTAIAWGTPYVNADEQAEVLGDNKVFIATGTSVTNTIYGYVVMKGDSSALLYAERFDTPVVVSAIDDAVAVIPKFTLGNR